MAEDKPRPTTVADIEIFDYIPPEREVFYRKRFEKQLDEILRVFERDRSGCMDVREFGTVVRAMGTNPSENDLIEMIESIEEPESTGTLQVAKVRELVLSLVLTKSFKNKIFSRDSEATIIKAFEALDKDKKGFISSEYLKEVMTSMGERFNADEVVEMINATADPETGNIYYEEFASLLATE
jgi:calmodulin